jgi:signal transduction histidine kinase
MILEGTLDLIQERLEGHLDAEEAALVTQGLSVCKSGERLVMSLLDLRPQDELTLAPLSLAPLLRSLEPALERATSPVPFKLSIEPSLHHAQVSADPVLIERLLFNLCVNARQAIAEAARSTPDLKRLKQQVIQVNLSPLDAQEDLEHNTHLTLEVIDTGPGLPKASLERLFDPSVSTRLGRGGHGLGLTAVSAICEQLNAPLSLTSEVGEGTRFCVTLARLPKLSS